METQFEMRHMPLGGISRSQLVSLVKKLHREYGDLPVPPSSDPFCLILWEQVAYLANDERRAEAYAQLKARVGLTPGDVLEASLETLEEVARVGGAIAVTDRATLRRHRDFQVQ